MIEDQSAIITADLYEVEVVDYELKQAPNSGRVYARIRLRILSHPEFRDRLLFLTIGTYSYAYRMLKACGIPKASPSDLTEDLIKKCLTLRMHVNVIHRQWEGRIFADPRIPQQPSASDDDYKPDAGFV